MQNIKENKTWQVNIHLNGINLTTNLKYLQIKYTTCTGREHIDLPNE